jgi:alkaline phosphatase
MKHMFVIFFIISAAFNQMKFSSSNQLEEKTIWLKKGQKKLLYQLKKTENKNIAKNVIIFLGDGMSLSTITAARIYSAQKEGKVRAKREEESEIVFEEFPYCGLTTVSF